jgi:hypothetical protein
MVARKQKSKSPKEETDENIFETSNSKHNQQLEIREGHVVIDEAYITSLTLKNDMQTDQINSLLLENQSLHQKVAALVLKVSALLKEKEQLTIQINDLQNK